MAERDPADRQRTHRAMIYCTQLFAMGSDARRAIALARALRQLMPTDLVIAGPICPQVADWAEDIRILPYEPGMAADYDLLWNVDPASYAEPLSTRNLAWVAKPHHNNVPSPEFELLSVSDHVTASIEQAWGRLSSRLYPTVPAQPIPIEKEKIILSVGGFAPSDPFRDNGHLQCIEQFRQLCAAGIRDWQLVLIGALLPGQGAYLDYVQEAALGLNIRLLPNADEPTLTSYMAMASVYWHLKGATHPDSARAKGSFPHSLVEAAAHGAVPLAVNDGAAPECVIHGYNGFVMASSDQCVEITRGLIQAPSAWAMLSQRAQVTSGGWTDADVFADRIRCVLQNQAAVRPPVPRWLDQAPSQDQVCAVVPAFNQADMTRGCLATLRELNPEVKIILVDNGSEEDLSAAVCLAEDSGGLVLRRESNDGLGAALAEAAPHCDRAFVALLHNDVLPVASGDWLDLLLAEMADEGVGIVGPKLKLADGETVQFAGWGFRPDNGGMFFHIGDGHRDEPRFSRRISALGVSSACMLCRRELFDPDPAYHLVYSDLDLCLKASAVGRSTIYQPASVLVHTEGATRGSLPNHSELAAADKARFFGVYEDAIRTLIARATP